MRLVRYSNGGADCFVGILEGDSVFDLEAVARDRIGHDDMVAVLAMPRSELAEIAAEARRTVPIRSATLRCPLRDPGRIYALAQNYLGPKTPPSNERANPWLFCKLGSPLGGPGDPIVLWDIADGVANEIEVAIVIGRSGRDIPQERALDHVAGYSVFNDVSARKLKLPDDRRDPALDGFFDWLHGKWLDGYSIMGPSIVTTDEVQDILGLPIKTIVSGELRSSGNTDQMIFDASQIVSFASRITRLQPGDIIATGTPHPEGPETYLAEGDLVEGSIGQLGSLVNPVVTPDRGGIA